MEVAFGPQAVWSQKMDRGPRQKKGKEEHPSLRSTAGET